MEKDLLGRLNRIQTALRERPDMFPTLTDERESTACKVAFQGWMENSPWYNWNMVSWDNGITEDQPTSDNIDNSHK